MALLPGAFMCLILFILGLWLGYELHKVAKLNWILCDDRLPPDTGFICTYPVAFFDPDFGVIVDHAEFHAREAIGTGIWLTVPHGEPCLPYAWFDLPAAPWPIYGALNNY